jgi:hypothetical protein
MKPYMYVMLCYVILYFLRYVKCVIWEEQYQVNVSYVTKLTAA